MRQIFGGAALIIAGIGALVVAGRHKPFDLAGYGPGYRHFGLSTTAYDLLRIGGWGLLIIGVLLIIVGLIGYWARVKRSA